MELSNKALAWLVVAAIAVSVFGTIVSLNKLNHGASGYLSYSNDTGTTSVSVASLTTLRFAIGQNTLNFGSGSVNVTNSLNCTMWILNSTPGAPINKSIGCSGFNNTAVNGGFVLENVGSTAMNVTLNFSGNSSQWLGTNGSEGTLGNSSLRFIVQENETGSCSAQNTTTNTTWTEVTTNGVTTVCNNLQYSPSTNSLKIGIWVAIPSMATGANKQLLIQANGIGP